MALTKQTVFRNSMKKFMLGGKQLQYSAPCKITVLFRGQQTKTLSQMCRPHSVNETISLYTTLYFGDVLLQ